MIHDGLICGLIRSYTSNANIRNLAKTIPYIRYRNGFDEIRAYNIYREYKGLLVGCGVFLMKCPTVNIKINKYKQRSTIGYMHDSNS